MKWKLVSCMLLAVCLLAGCASGNSETSETGIADGYDQVGGAWVAAGIYYENHLIDISDDEALMDLHDTTYLTFHEGGTFLYMNLYNFRGDYTRQNENSFILKTDFVFLYDFAEEGLVEKEAESASKPSYLVTLLDENTLVLETFDPVTGKAKVGSEPKLFEREGEESEYIQKNKTPLYEESDMDPKDDAVTAPEESGQEDDNPQGQREPFTNRYGTPTTRCFHAGCNNTIAPSGDSNCCTKHAAKCLNCNCYIDEDAMYCMSCLSGAVNDTTKPDSGRTDRADSCKFKYASGDICSSSLLPDL